MLRKLILASASALTVALPLGVPAAASAQVFVGVRVGRPVYYAPAPVVVQPVQVYQPAPVVVADPPPVVVSPPPPVVVTPPPVVVRPAPVVVAPAPVVVARPGPGRWRVEYRACATEPWRIRGDFVLRERAWDVERHLARRGFAVRVVRY